MILVDAGPLVALFDPKDSRHDHCVTTLKSIREPLRATVPVLTEAFYMLDPGSIGADRLRDFVAQGGLSVWFFNDNWLARAFELMEQYRDHPMDLADASIVAAAESLATRKVFTIDRRDFAAYRVRRGHRGYPFDIIR
jgi:predicted nucleic acid-binding protein